jgi:hypothetical protein
MRHPEAVPCLAAAQSAWLDAVAVSLVPSEALHFVCHGIHHMSEERGTAEKQSGAQKTAWPLKTHTIMRFSAAQIARELQR